MGIAIIKHGVNYGTSRQILNVTPKDNSLEKAFTTSQDLQILWTKLSDGVTYKVTSINLGSARLPYIYVLKENYSGVLINAITGTVTVDSSFTGGTIVVKVVGTEGTNNHYTRIAMSKEYSIEVSTSHTYTAEVIFNTGVVASGVSNQAPSTFKVYDNGNLITPTPTLTPFASAWYIVKNGDGVALSNASLTTDFKATIPANNNSSDRTIVFSNINIRYNGLRVTVNNNNAITLVQAGAYITITSPVKIVTTSGENTVEAQGSTHTITAPTFTYNGSGTTSVEYVCTGALIGTSALGDPTITIPTNTTASPRNFTLTANIKVDGVTKATSQATIQLAAGAGVLTATSTTGGYAFTNKELTSSDFNVEKDGTGITDFNISPSSFTTTGTHNVTITSGSLSATVELNVVEGTEVQLARRNLGGPSQSRAGTYSSGLWYYCNEFISGANVSGKKYLCYFTGNGRAGNSIVTFSTGNLIDATNYTNLYKGQTPGLSVNQIYSFTVPNDTTHLTAWENYASDQGSGLTSEKFYYSEIS